MNKSNDYQKPTPVSTPQDEPSIENDYVSHPEIEQPDPSTVTPIIPPEMPTR